MSRDVARCARRRQIRGGESAQAVIETALIIPVLLVMLVLFLGLMVQVQVQQEMDTATKLAVESVFQAPRCQIPSPAQPGAFCPRVATYYPKDNPGQPPSPPLYNTYTGLTYAYDSFYGTMVFYDQFLQWPASPHIDCVGPYLGGAAFDSTAQEVQCTASATLRFDRTPLAWAVVWNPTVRSLASAFPPPFRN